MSPSDQTAAAPVPAPSADVLPTTIEPRPEYGQFGGIIALPADVNLVQLPELIVKVAKLRHWAVLSQAPGKIVLTNQNKSWFSQLTFLWTPDKIVVYSNTTKDGKPTLPNSWIDNLRRDLTKILFPQPEKKKS